MKTTACLILVLLVNLPGRALSQEPVYFADSNLKAAVEEALGISDPTPNDMLDLFFLDASNRGIVDLTGLERAINLLELGLANNKINDITSLSGLTSILWLDLGHNQIRNISELSGLINVVSLFLNDNQISDISALSEFYFLLLLDLRHNPLNQDAHEIYIPLIYDNNILLHPFWWPIDYDPPSISYYELTIESTDGGSVTMPGEGSFYYYDQESMVALKAEPDPNYHFVNWTGTAVDAGKVTEPETASTMVVVDGRYTLRAGFQTPEGLVYFPDPNLQACVEHALGISNPAPEDMLLLTRLDSKDLPGRIITDLTGLEHATNLTELWLYGNRIIDIYALSSLTDLVMLDLGRNKIDDISPLAGLTKLTDLFLDDNWIWDTSPLSGLTNLKGLDLSVNGIDGLNSLSNMENLVWLGLEENEIFNISQLSQLNNLTELYLGWNYIEDVSALSGLTNLSVLDLSCNTDDYSIGELDISPLSELTNLTYLELEQNYIEDISPLSGLTNLDYLNLRINDIWDISPLSGLQNLTWLDLESNGIDDLSPLDGLDRLHHLNLKWNFITDISALSQVPSLEWVDLSQNDVNDISALLNLSHLERVLLWGNPLTDEACLQVQELIDRGVIVLCKCGVPVHTLTISSTSGGSVTEPGQGNFTQIVHGTTIIIEATADPDYYFVNWTGTAVDAGKVTDPSAAATTVIVDADYTVTVNFDAEFVPSFDCGENEYQTWGYVKDWNLNNIEKVKIRLMKKSTMTGTDYAAWIGNTGSKGYYVMDCIEADWSYNAGYDWLEAVLDNDVVKIFDSSNGGSVLSKPVSIKDKCSIASLCQIDFIFGVGPNEQGEKDGILVFNSISQANQYIKSAYNVDTVSKADVKIRMGPDYTSNYMPLTGNISLVNNPTVYEIWHEYGHFIQHHFYGIYYLLFMNKTNTLEKAFTEGWATYFGYLSDGSHGYDQLEQNIVFDDTRGDTDHRWGWVYAGILNDIRDGYDENDNDRIDGISEELSVSGEEMIWQTIADQQPTNIFEFYESFTQRYGFDIELQAIYNSHGLSPQRTDGN